MRPDEITHVKTIRESLISYFESVKFNNPIAVTLTLKRVSLSDYNGTRYHSYLDDVKTTQNIRHFLNRLNQRVFGSRFRRFGKRLKVIPVIEGDIKTRPHVHFTFDVPNHLSRDEFSVLVKECWERTQFGYHQHDITQIYDLRGWIDYKLKTRSKGDYGRSVDWENITID